MQKNTKNIFNKEKDNEMGKEKINYIFQNFQINFTWPFGKVISCKELQKFNIIFFHDMR